MQDINRDHLLLQLIAVTAMILFMLFIVMDDLERLKRITAPHLVFVATDPASGQKEGAGEPAPNEDADAATLN